MESTADTGRRRTVALIATGALVVVAGIALLIAQPSEAGSLAELGVIDERVEVRHTGEDAFRPATTGEALSAGSAVKTNRSGLASLAYSDGSLSRIGPSSTYELERLETDADRREIVGRLDSGQTFHRVAKVTGSSSRFEVRTSNAVAAVRGTAFAVQCLVANTCEIGVVEGRVAVRTPDGRTLEIPAGQRVTVDGEGDLGTLQLLSESDPWIERNAELDDDLTDGDGPSTTRPGSDGSTDEEIAGGDSTSSTTIRRGSADNDPSDESPSGAPRTTTTRDFTPEPNPQPDRRDGSATTTTSQPTTTTAAPAGPTTTAPPTTTTSAATSTTRATTTTTRPTTTTTRPTTTTRRPGTTSTTDDADRTTTTTRPTTTTQSTTTTTQPTTTTQSTTTTTQATTTTTNPNNASTTSTTSGSQSTTTTMPSCLDAPPPCRAPASSSSGWGGLLRLVSLFSLLGGTVYARSRKEPFDR